MTQTNLLRARDLRAKWIATTMAMVTLIAICMSAFAIHQRMAYAESALASKGQALAKLAAASSEVAVQVRDAGYLVPLAKGLADTRDISYASIHYIDATVAASAGRAARSAPHLGPAECRTEHVITRPVDVPGVGRVLEVIAPIRRFEEAEPVLFDMGHSTKQVGYAGVVRVGLSQEGARREILAAAGYTMLITFLILALAVVGALKMATSVTAPINQLVAATGKVAEGNLNWTVPVTREDEIGQLASTFNTMVTNLRSIIKRVRDGVVRISSAGSQLAAISEQQATGFAEQAASVEQITAAMEELAASAASIAENSEVVVEVAESAVEASTTGSHSVSDAIAEMERIRKTVENIASTALRLGDRSQKIGEFVNFIQDISAETHLLAVNAAIESAAAGEHGKRFAVVASEVRRLAERSRVSADEIKSLVTEIQGAINAAVLATEQGTKEVEAGATLARSVEDNLRDIMQLIARTSQVAKEISLATSHQRTASDQILAVLRGIADGVRTSASEMRQATSSVSQLTELAEAFKEDVQRFVVD